MTEAFAPATIVNPTFIPPKPTTAGCRGRMSMFSADDFTHIIPSI